MTDLNTLLAQIMGMTGGMGVGQMGMTNPPMMAKPTYALGQGASTGMESGPTAGGGKAGMGGIPGIASTAAQGLKQSGLLPKPVSSGLSGASTGATLGSLGGPIGTGIGAGVGGLAGLLGGKGGGPNPKAQNISVGNIPLGGY